MYLYHILFVSMNIYGVQSQKTTGIPVLPPRRHRGDSQLVAARDPPADPCGRCRRLWPWWWQAPLPKAVGLVSPGFLVPLEDSWRGWGAATGARSERTLGRRPQRWVMAAELVLCSGTVQVMRQWRFGLRDLGIQLLDLEGYVGPLLWLTTLLDALVCRGGHGVEAGGAWVVLCRCWSRRGSRDGGPGWVAVSVGGSCCGWAEPLRCSGLARCSSQQEVLRRSVARWYSAEGSVAVLCNIVSSSGLPILRSTDQQAPFPVFGRRG
jgi:hypothetical protein